MGHGKYENGKNCHKRGKAVNTGRTRGCKISLGRTLVGVFQVRYRSHRCVLGAACPLCAEGPWGFQNKLMILIGRLLLMSVAPLKCVECSNGGRDWCSRHQWGHDYRVTSLLRNCHPVGPYRSLCLGSYGGPRGVGFFSWAKHP